MKNLFVITILFTSLNVRAGSMLGWLGNVFGKTSETSSTPVPSASVADINNTINSTQATTEQLYYLYLDNKQKELDSQDHRRNKRLGAFAVDPRVRRHSMCLRSLEQYFTKEVSTDEMKEFLNAQYELTMYKTFGAMLTQKMKHQKNGNKNLAKLNIKDLLAQNIKDMQRRYAKSEKFQKAAKSFDASPLSVDTFAQLMPFLQEYFSYDEKLYQNEPGKSFMLNYRDLKMLHVMSEMEMAMSESERKAKTIIEQDAESFLIKLNRLDNSKLYGKNVEKTVEDIKLTIVKPRLAKIDRFMSNLKLPEECKQERKDLASLYNCTMCYHRNKDDVKSLINMSREVTNTLFQSLLKRSDLNKQKDYNLRNSVFYYGKDSAWGRYE